MTVKREKPIAQYKTSKGSYKIVKKLGKGGCSTVHLGEDLETTRKVAIKISFRDTESIRAINEEARILNNLSHKGIVAIRGQGRKERN